MNYPIKLSLKTELVPILAIAASLIFGFYFYPQFPEQIISHWNFEGQPDGFSGKFFGAFGVPLFMIGLYVLFLALPLLDPKSERYGQFSKAYHIFKASILLVLFVIFLAMGFSNLGYHIPIDRTVSLLVGIFLILIGNYMGKIKPNWFMGIRTPWTLSSENVWNKTHRLGGFMFLVLGFLIIISPFLPKAYGLTAFIAGIALTTGVTTIYSYLEYKKERRQGAAN